VKKMSEEEAKEEERNKGKREIERKKNGGEALREPRTGLRAKDKGRREVQKWKVLGATALTRNEAKLFPTTQRPEMRSLIGEEVVSFSAVEQWFASTALQLGSSLTDTERERVKRLLYTWGDVFKTDLVRICKTDLIEHGIILEPEAKPHRARIPLYTEEEINFCKRLLPKMKEASLIYRYDSHWGARTKFPLKP